MLKRNFLNILSWGAVVALVLCLAPVTANASLLCTAPGSVNMGTYCEVVFGGFSYPGGGSQPFDFPSNAAIAITSFNTDWGTLTGMSISATFTAQVSVLERSTTGGQVVTGTAWALVDLSQPDHSALGTVPTSTVISINHTFESATPPADFTATSSTLSGAAVLSPGNLSLYEATGDGHTVSLPVSSSALISANYNFGKVTLTPSGSGSVELSVTYDYVPADAPPSVPEPVTLALFGSGLLLMGWMGRKRIKR
ncbi:MAG: PEP-CTERM sorting domain-containing protein [Acidobacteriia bacterium]|nr:PEP-CTERM sorting domain-containing protein [Terriglobia bacterium]